MPKIWSFFSPKGGVGKSTLCVHLAAALYARGVRVTLVDASPLSPALDVLCGVSEQVVYTLADVASDAASAERALLPVERLTSSAKRRKEKKTAEKDAQTASPCLLPIAPDEKEDGDAVSEALQKLVALNGCDILLVDASCGMYDAIAPLSEHRVILTEPNAISLRAAEAFAANHADENACFLSVGASLCAEKLRAEPAVIDMIDRVALPIRGIVPFAPWLRSGGMLLEKCHRKEPYVWAIGNIAARLLGENVPLLTNVKLDGISRRSYLERTSSEEF